MSFEAENWSDVRGRASQKLFESLRTSRHSNLGDALHQTAPNLPDDVGQWPSHAPSAGEKRKRDHSEQQEGRIGTWPASTGRRGEAYVYRGASGQIVAYPSRLPGDSVPHAVLGQSVEQHGEVKWVNTQHHANTLWHGQQPVDPNSHTPANAAHVQSPGQLSHSHPITGHVPDVPPQPPPSSQAAVVDLTLSDSEDDFTTSTGGFSNLPVGLRQAAARAFPGAIAPEDLQPPPARRKKAPNRAPAKSMPSTTLVRPTQIHQAVASTAQTRQSPTGSAPAKTCSCGKSTAGNGYTAVCANDSCPFGTFHKTCVGLGTRKVVTNWRCRECRPKPPPLSSQTMPMPASSPPGSSQPSDVILPPVPIAKGPAEPPLHPEQARVVDCILDGENVFYTGSAGVGKSTVLKAFVKKLKHQGKHVDIIAPSGIAALNVGGKTVFAYAGWRPDSLKLPMHKIRSMGHGRLIRKRLNKTDVLVIDEISMVERDLLTRLDHLMRESREGWFPASDEVKMSPHRAELPFGGVQVVVTGDFCQLPPVKPFKTCMTCGGNDLPGYHMQDGRTLTCPRCLRQHEDKDKWAFSGDTWRSCNFRYFELKHIHRQNDKNFIDILQRCRYGQAFTPDQEALLLNSKPDPVGAVRLLPRRVEVENQNIMNFNGLKSKAREYDCTDCFFWKNKEEPDLQKKNEPRYSDRPDGPLLALKDHRLEEEVKLKEGMLVILLVNLDFKQGLVNGSQGKIVGFEEHDEARVFAAQGPADSSDGSPKKANRHSKDKSSSPEYVRIKEAEIRKFIARAPTKQWPVVEFHNGVKQPIYAHCQINELGSDEPYSLIGRTQIPLLAAWAITVHKSQGMTLDRVIVDLYNSFEREMVYVALSRARNLEGLKVVRLPRNMADGVNVEVRQFLRSNGLGGSA